MGLAHMVLPMPQLDADIPATAQLTIGDSLRQRSPRIQVRLSRAAILDANDEWDGLRILK
jgi:hypothetical protein